MSEIPTIPLPQLLDVVFAAPTIGSEVEEPSVSITFSNM
jgi:hypothetical protein